MENFCVKCDAVLHTECDENEFYNHEVGRIECPDCGAINKPCNECEDTSKCDVCPWTNAKILKCNSNK